MNVILCGLPRCGKTTLGKKLAKEFNYTFIDTDQLLEELYFEEYGSHLSTREIYCSLGEENFRRLESKAILSLKPRTHTIISTGSGAFLDSKNANYLKSMGFIIYLTVSWKTLLKRIQNPPMPAFIDPSDPKVSIEKLSDHRVPIYKKYADLIVNTEDMSKNDVISFIKNEIIY